MEEVTRVVLPNGITIHLKEIHTAPLISHWVWYRVGSRDEIAGITGISHWVEHMQFKGTPNYPPSVLDKAISREGGMWNAFTHLDWTTYFETLPADKIDLGLNLEADRMQNSLFDPADVESERTVIISEREGSENEPQFRLGEAVQKAAFQVHSYGHEVIGDPEDLQNMQRDDLFNHYRKYYHPANALIAVAGDFKAREMLDHLQNLYGGIAANGLPARTVQPEPPARSEQRLELIGPGETTYLQIAYHAPSAANSDFFSLMVLDSLLSGPTGLNMFGGGGISNKTSRLYRSLVEGELAVSVYGGLQATIDPYLYDISATVRPGRTPAEVLAAIDAEVQRLQDEPVNPAEIERAMKQARALFVYGSENITNQAFWLGYAEMFADYNWFTGYIEHLQKVTPADIQRIAQTYLHPSNRVVGTYLPTGEQEVEEEADE